MISNKLEKRIPFVTSECPSGPDVSELTSGVDIFDLDLLGPGLFCRRASQEPLCGFEKRVSSSDFCFLRIISITASLSDGA